MAEIHVQRKNPGAWVWIVGILALLLVLWAAAALRDDNETQTAVVTLPGTDEAATTRPSATGDAPSAAVAAFLTFADAPPDAGATHEYSADGIRRLTAALSAIVGDGPETSRMREEFADFRQKADRIQADPQAMRHANQVRDVFTSAAAVMSTIQQDRWSGSAGMTDDIRQVQSAAEAVKGDRPLLEQTREVTAFFDEAADVIGLMSRRG